MEKKEMNSPMDIGISEEVAQGLYSNLALVSHSPTDFIVDFAQLLPGMPAPKVRSRIVLAPEHAKRLAFLLKENIDRYEENFGEIRMRQSKTTSPMELFDMPKGEA